MGKLYAVEGGSGSGKDALLAHLAHQGNIVMRGIPSQTPQENSLLNPKSQEILDNTLVNIYTMRDEPLDVFDRYIKVMASQLDQAVDYKDKGLTVFLNRSIISFFAHYFLVGEPKLTEELNEMIKKIYSSFTTAINGIVIMTVPMKSGTVKEGIAGLQNEESKFINDFAENLHLEKNIPLLKLNANQMSVEDEISKIREFVK